MPCVICGRALKPAFGAPIVGGNPHQADGAVMFTSPGNYGSVVYDEQPWSRRYLLVNVCDACLTEAGRLGRAIEVTAAPQPDTQVYEVWEAPRVAEDEENGESAPNEATREGFRRLRELLAGQRVVTYREDDEDEDEVPR